MSLDVAALYEAHQADVLAYVARRVQSFYADDLAAAVWERAVAAAPRYVERGAPPSAWLYAIARNLVTDHYRRPASAATEPLGADALRMPAQNWRAPYARIEDRMVLAPAIAQLSRRQQEVVRLRYDADQTSAATGSVLGINENATKKVQRRAVASLRRLIGEDAA